LIDDAAEINLQTTATRVDAAVVKPQVIEIYKKVVKALVKV
jgi:hypothetical protein